jgi:hypothetical protein
MLGDTPQGVQRAVEYLARAYATPQSPPSVTEVTEAANP